MPVKKDVVICIPAYDNKTEFEIYRAIEDAKNDPENPVSALITYNGDSLVSRARNELALMFEQMPPDQARFLMFIDSDIHFKPSDITKLRAHNLPVVAGMYFLKNMTSTPVLNSPVGNLVGTLQQVREVGTGFLMIRRDTLGALKASGYAKQYRAGSNQHNVDVPRTEYFPVGVVDGILMSEDYYFSRLCEMVNIPCYVDTHVIVGHKGWALYPFKPRLLVKSLPAALRSFRTNQEDEKITDAEWDDLLKAWEEHRSRNEAPKVIKNEPVIEEFVTDEAGNMVLLNIKPSINKDVLSTLVRDGTE